MNEETNYLQVGVKVILQNEEGKVLLLRRSHIKYPEAGATWDIVGGRINIGIPLLDNLKREVMEETGLTLASEPSLIFAQDILHVSRFPGRHVVRLTYIAHASGQPVIDEESLDFAWFSFEEIKKMPTEELDPYFKEVFEKIK